MKIMCFCNLVPRKLGAYENYLIALGRGLRDGGDTMITVFAADPAPAVIAALRDAGIAWHTIPRWAGEGEKVYPYTFCLPAVRLVRRERPDVAAVHFGDEISSLIAIMLTRLVCRRPPRWVWHQRQQIADPTPLTARFSRIRLAGLGFDHFVTVYDGGRRSIRLRGIPDDRITSIHNGLKEHVPDMPPDSVRRELMLPSDALVVGCIGWLISRKRIAWGIRAFAQSVERLPIETVLLVVGDGPERRALERLAAELGVAERVRFLGYRTDARDILTACDLLIHAACAEACVNVVTEAMAAGKPVVMTDAGAAREQIEDGVSGFVVAPDDFEGLTDRLATLIKDDGLRAKFGKEARRRWERMFRLETSVAKHCRLYRRLAGQTED